MTHTHAGLRQYRSELRAAIARDLRRGPATRPGSRRALAIGLPATAAAATAAVLFVSGGGPTGPTDAQAAILRHVSRALSAPAGMILHQRAMVSLNGQAPQRFELWEQTASPYRYRVIKWGHEGVGTSSHDGVNNPAETLRKMVASGQTTATATTFEGQAAFKLSVQGAPDPWVDGVAYVAQSDYHPLEIISHGETIRYMTYEYLPATAANQQLLQPVAGPASAK